MANVFKYLDYRKFLKAKFMELKNTRETFSHRAFARMAGFSSSNYMMLVMQGKRNLSGEGLLKVSKALKLKKKEAEFFENLVRFDQSKTDEERNFHYGRIAATRQYVDARPLEAEQYDYYSHWYIPVIREMVLMGEFSEDSTWISKNITPNITPKEASDAINLLLEIGLLVRDDSGKLIQHEKHISGGDEVASLAMKNFQRDMIRLAGQSIEETPAKMREISSVTFSVSKDRFAEARKMIREFRSRLAGFLSEEEKGEAVYQFNIQLFNLSKIEGKKEEE